jgi:hypothetical protein
MKKIMETEKYINLWKKYLAVIRIQLKNSLRRDEMLQLSKIEFEAAGDRDSSGYTFNLEIQNGQIANDISGTAVARHLYKVLNDDAILNEFLKGKKIKISLSKSFILKLKVSLI